MKKVRYGIVGAGLMGIEHIRNLLAIDGAVVTAIADDHPGSLAACADVLRNEDENWEAVEYFTNVRDMLTRTPSICDVTIISTPNHTHFEILMTAYECSAPEMTFLVEKPLCTTIEDCRIVVKAAEKRAAVTYVGLEYCYMPPIARVIRDAGNGVIGLPIMCGIREHRFPFLKKVRNWNRFNENSGGTLVEKTCHFFDLFNRVFAGHSPVTVFASGAQDVNHLSERYEGRRPDILDNAYVVINYSGGQRAMLDLCMFAEASHAQEEIVIVGAKGKLEAFLPQLEVRTGIRGEQSLADVVVERVDDRRIKYYGHHHGSSYLEHLDLRSRILDQQSSASNAGMYAGLLSVAMGVAAQQSVKSASVIHMTDLLSPSELNLAQY